MAIDVEVEQGYGNSIGASLFVLVLPHRLQLYCILYNPTEA